MSSCSSGSLSLSPSCRCLPVGVAVAHGRDCEIVTGNAALGEMLGSGLGDGSSEATLSLAFKLSHSGELLLSG